MQSEPIGFIMSIVPYKDSPTTKKEQVAAMFDQISPKYDLLNHALSLGIDILWRRKAIQLLEPYHPKSILDIATGTADLAIEANRLKPEEIIGIDISAGMLDLGKVKLKKLNFNHISLMQADSEQLPFENQRFDCVMASFGVRNFENLELGLSEMHRVLKTGGVTMILEFSQPERWPFKQLYQFYFNSILPNLGRWVSKDKSAYTYLPESVREFPYGQRFANNLDNLGFKNIRCIPLTFGISTIYLAEK
jgi:demethylmenaquinone methyltransferase / 2-methoxy-6-polyprenyl-1,4-benzoquinol methylase